MKYMSTNSITHQSWSLWNAAILLPGGFVAFRWAGHAMRMAMPSGDVCSIPDMVLHKPRMHLNCIYTLFFIA
jgi:hypothetical protein